MKKFRLKDHFEEEEPVFYHNTDKYGRQVTVCVLKTKIADLPQIPYEMGNNVLEYHFSNIKVPGVSKDNETSIINMYTGWKHMMITAKVTCCEKDTYDEELGEKLALAKARYKTYIKWRDLLGNVLSAYIFYINDIMGECNMNFYKWHTSEKNYYKLLNEQTE